MDFISMFLGIVFTALGIVFACGRGHIYLTAWKNMTREEKEKINIVPLCRNIGGVIALCGVIFLIKGVFNGERERKTYPARGYRAHQHGDHYTGACGGGH